MTTPDPISPKARDALFRESKDLIAIDVLALCDELRIRAMVGGGPVLNAHGLVTPVLASSVGVLVDPACLRDLRTALLARGWRDAKRSGTSRVLPPALLDFRHPDEVAALTLYTVIPGFFADPAVTFDLFWEQRKGVELRGHTVLAVGRLGAAILASHEGFEGRTSRVRENADYLAQKYAVLLDAGERSAAVALIRTVGGCAEMSRLVLGLGEQPCEFELPSVGYTQWRLQVSKTTDQLRRMLAWLELGAEGRALMRASRPGRPRTVRDVLIAALSLPGSAAVVLGARGRWDRSVA